MALEVEKITQDNFIEYEEYFCPDKAENMVRRNCHGLALRKSGGKKCEAALLWEVNGAEAEIMDFYMEDKGAFKEALTEYGKEASQEGVTNTIVKIPVGSDISVLEAFRETGFQLQEEKSSEVIMQVGELNKSPLALKRMNMENIAPVGSLSIQQFRRIISNCMACKKPGHMDDLMWLPADWFEPDLSCCILTEEGAKGVFLVHKTVSEKLEVQLMQGFAQALPQDILKMIQYAMISGGENYASETQIVINCCDVDTEALVEKLFHKVADTKVIVGRRIEK